MHSVRSSQRILLCHVLHIIVPVGVKPQLVPVLCHALRKLGVLRNAVAAEKKRRVDVPLRKPVQKLLRDFARGSVVEGQGDIALRFARVSRLRGTRAGKEKRQCQYQRCDSFHSHRSSA